MFDNQLYYVDIYTCALGIKNSILYKKYVNDY